MKGRIPETSLVFFRSMGALASPISYLPVALHNTCMLSTVLEWEQQRPSWATANEPGPRLISLLHDTV